MVYVESPLVRTGLLIDRFLPSDNGYERASHSEIVYVGSDLPDTVYSGSGRLDIVYRGSGPTNSVNEGWSKMLQIVGARRHSITHNWLNDSLGRNGTEQS